MRGLLIQHYGCAETPTFMTVNHPLVHACVFVGSNSSVINASEFVCPNKKLS